MTCDPIRFVHPLLTGWLGCALIAGALLATTPGSARAFAQTSEAARSTVDRHYGLVIDRQLWLNPVAHGYQHGYEDGFHRGEWAHQMYDHPPAIRKQADWKKADRGYVSAMGDREEFRRGYRQGYEQGYVDAYSGHSFQALVWLQRQIPSLACLSGCRPPLVAVRPPAPR